MLEKLLDIQGKRLIFKGKFQFEQQDEYWRTHFVLSPPFCDLNNLIEKPVAVSYFDRVRILNHFTTTTQFLRRKVRSAFKIQIS